MDMTQACTGTNEYHEVSPATSEMAGTGLKISSMLFGRLYRDTGDTWVGTGSNGPALLQLDLHIQQDEMGSMEEWIK